MIIYNSMNIIEEQRNQIINNNNTAQERLNAIIDTMNKAVDEIHISEPLNGDLDLDVLKSFKIIRLSFVTGNITSIKNIPKEVRHLEITENLLLSLPELPNNLEHLDINHNYIDTIPEDSLPKTLKVLNVSHNNLETLTDLPQALEDLNCSNNRITFLSLSGLTKLHTLDIGHNKLSVIVNFPEGVENFYNENNPTFEYRESENIPQEKQKKGETHDYNNAVKEYLRYKQNYEEVIRKFRKKTLESVSSKKGRVLRMHNFKPKCIHCKRNVGTIFEMKDSSYRAYCGSSTDPCKLNIDIDGSPHNIIHKFIEEYNEDLQELKSFIIKHKMDSIFNYVHDSEIARRFEKDNEDLEFITTELRKLHIKYEELFDNEKKEEAINKLKSELFVYREEFQSHLESFKSTQNREHLQAAMKLYQEQIVGIQKNIHTQKYPTLEMHSDFVNGFTGKEEKADIQDFEWRMTAKPIVISDLDYAMLEHKPNVKSFVV